MQNTSHDTPNSASKLDSGGSDGGTGSQEHPQTSKTMVDQVNRSLLEAAEASLMALQQYCHDMQVQHAAEKKALVSEIWEARTTMQIRSEESDRRLADTCNVFNAASAKHRTNLQESINAAGKTKDLLRTKEENESHSAEDVSIKEDAHKVVVQELQHTKEELSTMKTDLNLRDKEIGRLITENNHVFSELSLMTEKLNEREETFEIAREELAQLQIDATRSNDSHLGHLRLAEEMCAEQGAMALARVDAWIHMDPDQRGAEPIAMSSSSCSEIAVLGELVTALQEEVAERASQINYYRCREAEMESELSELQRGVEDREFSSETTLCDLARLRSEIVSQDWDSKARMGQYENKLEECEGELHETEKQMSSLATCEKNEQHPLSSDFWYVTKELSILQQSADSANLEIASLSECLQQKTSELQDYGAELEKYDRLVHRFEQRVVASSQYEALEEELERLKKELGSKNSMNGTSQTPAEQIIHDEDASYRLHSHSNVTVCKEGELEGVSITVESPDSIETPEQVGLDKESGVHNVIRHVPQNRLLKGVDSRDHSIPKMRSLGAGRVAAPIVRSSNIHGAPAISPRPAPAYATSTVLNSCAQAPVVTLSSRPRFARVDPVTAAAAAKVAAADAAAVSKLSGRRPMMKQARESVVAKTVPTRPCVGAEKTKIIRSSSVGENNRGQTIRSSSAGPDARHGVQLHAGMPATRDDVSAMSASTSATIASSSGVVRQASIDSRSSTATVPRTVVHSPGVTRHVSPTWLMMAGTPLVQMVTPRGGQMSPAPLGPAMSPGQMSPAAPGSGQMSPAPPGGVPTGQTSPVVPATMLLCNSTPQLRVGSPDRKMCISQSFGRKEGADLVPPSPPPHIPEGIRSAQNTPRIPDSPSGVPVMSMSFVQGAPLTRSGSSGLSPQRGRKNIPRQQANHVSKEQLEAAISRNQRLIYEMTKMREEAGAYDSHEAVWMSR